jgi:hypothetical protein
MLNVRALLISVLVCVLAAGCRREAVLPDGIPASVGAGVTGGYVAGHALLADAAQGGHTGILVYLAGTSFNARTDENGAYAISSVSAGGYTIIAERQGYQNVTVGNVTVDPDIHTRERPFVAQTAILERSESTLTTSTVRRVARPLGSLLGYVTLSGARSSEKVIVRIDGTPLITVTDEAGLYRFLNVEQGAYRLSYEIPGYRSVSINAVVVAGEETKADSVIMDPEDAVLPGSGGAAAISMDQLSGDRMILGVVRVIDEDGKELRDFQRVTLALDNSDYVVNPNDAGRFEFTRLPEGVYSVLASLDGASPVPNTVDLRDKKVVDLRISLVSPPKGEEQKGIVKGRIVLPGEDDEPLADASGVQVGLGGTRLIMMTASDGVFKIEDALPSTYVLSATREGYEAFSKAGVEVAPGQTLDLGDVIMQPKRDYPRVVGTDPVDGASNIVVGLDLVVKIRFSKAMDPNSVIKAISVQPPASWQAYMGSGSHPAANDNTAAIVFSNLDESRPIRYNTNYRFTVAKSASDLRGLGMKQDFQFGFVTGAPGIVSTYPADGAMNARVSPIDTPLSVVFNTRIKAESLDQNAIRIRPRPDAQPNIQFDTDSRTGWTKAAIFVTLDPGANYSVTIGRGVRTFNNQALSNTPYTFRFRTERQDPILIHPQVVR